MEDIADKIERSLSRYLDSIYEMRCRITDDRLKPGPLWNILGGRLHVLSESDNTSLILNIKCKSKKRRKVNRKRS